MSVERLAELLRAHQPCVVLTGAGVSTESGIPDFRSPTGIWRRYDPMEYATIDAFLADPEKVWGFYGQRLAALADVEPNDGHRALAHLEERGWVDAVVTQNVDGLHARAGSRTVVEVHGSNRTSSCLECGTSVPFAEALARLPVPACPTCGRVLKPDVVMFGELLPQAARSRSSTAARPNSTSMRPSASTPARARRSRPSPRRYPTDCSEAAKIASCRRRPVGAIARVNTGTTRSPANAVSK
jgi:NAD-dependent deacetylase